jgi:hypothetical protein
VPSHGSAIPGYDTQNGAGITASSPGFMVATSAFVPHLFAASADGDL